MQRHRAIHMARLHEYRRLERPALVSQLHHVASFDAEAMRRGRAEECRVVPSELGDGLGQLLQPAVVGERPS